MAIRTTSKRKKLTKLQTGLKHGFRSGLEVDVAKQLEDLGVDYTYESFKIPFIQPTKSRTYTPDYQLPNGIIIETKGQFKTEDRQKHLWVKQQNPELDIRFVFSRSLTKIAPRSPTTYADWCIKNGFLFSDKLIPIKWIKEI